MNITFLVGNGFDLNLGLDTRYSDFLKEYLQESPEDDEEIRIFKSDIKEQTNSNSDTSGILWANAELAFGKYTDDIVKQGKNADAFSKRQTDFCIKLAAYLQEQEKRICVDNYEQAFVDAIHNIYSGLTVVQNDAVKNSDGAFNGNYTFNFLIFNYTCIVDSLIKAAQEQGISLGTRTSGNTNYQNGFGEVIHVHGTTEADMVFGVNDESQIRNMALFEGVSPIYLSSFIKPKTNDIYEARVDEKAHDLIKKSSFIYIYGMSLGDTDKIWWQRIIERMKAQINTHVFIYFFDVPKNKLWPTQRLLYEEKKKKQFLSFADGNNSSLESRIHIVDTDIFAALANIADKHISNSIEMANMTVLPLSS